MLVALESLSIKSSDLTWGLYIFLTLDGRHLLASPQEITHRVTLFPSVLILVNYISWDDCSCAYFIIAISSQLLSCVIFS